MKKKKQKQYYWLILTFLILGIGVLVWAINVHKRIILSVLEEARISTEMKKTQRMHAQNIEISFDMPYGYSSRQIINGVVLKNNIGEIVVNRQATNATDLHEYLTDFDSKRAINVLKEERLEINNYGAIARVEHFNGGPVLEEKVYYIYIDNSLYSFSTSDDRLYSDLDQIAQSFHYVP